MLRTYLKECKALMNTISSSKEVIADLNLKFVIGNEAGDMDSILSSFLYGFHKNHLETNNENTHFIPIISTEAANIFSRFEAIYLLKNLKYDLSDFIYQDQFPLAKIIEDYNAEIILVDHNYPSGYIKNHVQHVTEILDHHDDKTSLYSEGQIKWKRIEKIGSTTTLVFDEMWNNLSCYEDGIETDICWFILCTILTDTFNLNLKEKGIRWVEKDEWAKETLCKLLYNKKDFPKWMNNHGEVNTDLIFETLVGLKFDVGMNLELGLEQLVVKDYKAFTYPKGKVGYSVFMINFEDLFKRYSKEEFEKFIKEFREKEELRVVIWQFVNPKDPKKPSDLRREALIYFFSESGEEINKIVQFILQSKLALEELPHGLDSHNFRRLFDVNSVYTRKILEPLIAKFMSE